MTAPCQVKDGFSEAAMPGRKQVFFEKKNQKTFVPGGPAISLRQTRYRRPNTLKTKVFWSFFSKKDGFLPR
jgi:hypothetical protein